MRLQPKKWAEFAKENGFKYLIFTTKHHDGFCLFKSAVDGYNTYDYYGRDICRELVDACNEEGLEVGFYYSHTLDSRGCGRGSGSTLPHPKVRRPIPATGSFRPFRSVLSEVKWNFILPP